MSGIILCGCLTADFNKSVDRWPEQETLSLVHSVSRESGGMVHNVASNLRHLAPTLAQEVIALVGDDENGVFVRGSMERLLVDTRQLQVTAAATTAITDAVVPRGTGRRTHFHHPGANGLLSPAMIDLEAVQGWLLHLGTPGIMPTLDGPWLGSANGWQDVLRRGKARGLCTSLELASIPADQLARLTRPCLPDIDFLIINDYEAGALASLETVRGERTDVLACRKAALWLLRSGVGRAVIIHFPGGAIGVSREQGTVEQPSVRIPRAAVQGSNGAGDAFASGALSALIDGGSLALALRLGHSVAAASLRHLSACASVESAAACLALADCWGWRSALCADDDESLAVIAATERGESQVLGGAASRQAMS